MPLDSSQVADIVSRVLTRLQEQGVASEKAPPPRDCWTRRPLPDNDRPLRRRTPAEPAAEKPAALSSPKRQPLGPGLYDDVDAAVRAADRA